MPLLATLLALVLVGCGGSEARLVAPTVSVNAAPEVRVEGLDGGQVVELSAAWSSDFEIAEAIEAGGRARIEPLVYDEAGHAVGAPLPYLPGRPTNLTGGTPEADERARRELWPKILRALR